MPSGWPGTCQGPQTWRSESVASMLSLLDRQTLAVVVACVSLVTWVVMLTIWFINREIQGLRWWMGASLTSVLGFLTLPLAQLFGGSFSTALVLNHAASLISLSLMLQGSLAFCGCAGARPGAKLLPGLWVLAVVLAWGNRDHAMRRYLMHDAAAVALLLGTAFTLSWRSRPQARAAQRLAAAFAGLMALALASRWGLAWQAQNDLAIQNHPIQGVLHLVIVIFTMGWTYSVSLACYQLAQAQVLNLAREDALTGLPNRRYFDEMLDREVWRAERSGTPFALVMADINGFKLVNDQLGHAVGDALLIEVGRRLQAFARGGDFVARLGGDEFIVLLHDVASVGPAEQAVARLRAALDGPMSWAGRAVPIELSLGSARWPEDGQQPGQLVQQADQRMYAEKAQLKAQRGLRPAA